MKKSKALSICAAWTLGAWATVLAAPGCSQSEDPYDGFTEAEWAKIHTLGPLMAPPADTTNKYADNPAAALLGQKFFYDKRYSGPIEVGDDGTNGGVGAKGETGKVACDTCHLADHSFIDSRSNPNNTSLAINWFFRNAPSMVNVAYYTEWFGWSGFNDNLWGKNLIPMEFVMATNRLVLAHHIYKYYQAEYNALFSPPLDPALDPASPGASRFPPSGAPKANASDPDGPWELMTAADRDIVNRIVANYGKSIAAFERKLVSRNAPLDKYLAGDLTALSASAKRGLKLFIGKAGCVACHKDPGFSDQKFHNTGVPQIGDHVLGAPNYDPGRQAGLALALSWNFNTASPYSDDPKVNRVAGLGAKPTDLGAFRTKGLRNVADSAPYMHTGHLKTLEEVVAFYNTGGATSGFAGTKDPLMKPLNLTSQEQSDMVDFLKSLTGEPIPISLRSSP